MANGSWGEVHGENGSKRLLEAGHKKKQRRARLRFATDHKDWTIEDYSKVIFSDESNFQLFPIPVHLMFRRRPGEAYKPQCLAPMLKFGWGLWWSGGASARLESGRFIFAKGTWIKPPTRFSWKKTCFPLLWQCSLTSEDCFFQQDNAPCQTAKSIKVWEKAHQIKTLSWPAQSPDLNQLKTSGMWSRGRLPSNKAELLEFLRQEWHKVT